MMQLRESMIKHNDIDKKITLLSMIKHGQITMAGNASLKIYGTLHCASGKRMNRKNRVFFSSEEEAISLGYRPCGHCMKEQYQQWKHKRNAGDTL